MQLVSGDLRLRPLRRRDGQAWREVRQANTAWLAPWEASSPGHEPVPATFGALVRALDQQGRRGESLPFALEWRGRFAGQVTVGNVVWGSLRSANVGYWLDGRLAGRGIMPEAVAVVVDHCFSEVGLHRLEVNIRPENGPSRRVVEKLGLRCEGVRERYLHIAGVWCDHLSYAVTRDEVPEGMWNRWQQRSRPPAPPADDVAPTTPSTVTTPPADTPDPPDENGLESHQSHQ